MFFIVWVAFILSEQKTNMNLIKKYVKIDLKSQKNLQKSQALDPPRTTDELQNQRHHSSHQLSPIPTELLAWGLNCLNTSSLRTPLNLALIQTTSPLNMDPPFSKGNFLHLSTGTHLLPKVTSYASSVPLPT